MFEILTSNSALNTIYKLHVAHLSHWGAAKAHSYTHIRSHEWNEIGSDLLSAFFSTNKRSNIVHHNEG